jgi:hypothetical protein
MPQTNGRLTSSAAQHAANLEHDHILALLQLDYANNEIQRLTSRVTELEGRGSAATASGTMCVADLEAAGVRIVTDRPPNDQYVSDAGISLERTDK